VKKVIIINYFNKFDLEFCLHVNKQRHKMDTIQNKILIPLLRGECYDDMMNNLKSGDIKFGHKTEKLCLLLIAAGAADNILDSPFNVQDGSFEVKDKPLKNFNDISDILKRLICANDNDKSDITLKDIQSKIHPISVKTGEQGGVPSETDCTFLKDRLNDDPYNQIDTWPILICDDKNIFSNHKGKKDGKDKEYQKEMVIHNKVKDITDIKIWISVFHKKYKGLSVDEFIDKINSEILNKRKSYLKIRVHQEITKLKIMRLINGGRKHFVISHKPRSGKTYLILYMLNIMIQEGKISRVLIWTSVKDTIKQFIDIIEGHYDFNDLKYHTLEKNNSISEDFKGIVFTTCQYLKCDTNGLKKGFLEKNNFDAIVIDESHWGSSTTKTISSVLHSIMKNCEDQFIFYLSATPRKTISKYHIPNECIFKWDIIDEGYMKNIDKFYDNLVQKYGKDFENVYSDDTICKIYDNCPIPIMIKPDSDDLTNLSNKINEYNKENNTELGISFKSLFALEQEVKGRKVKCKSNFQLANTSKGTDILKFFLNMICDNDSQGDTIYDLLQEIQSDHGSRKSTVNDPACCLVFTSDMGNIDVFQRTFIKFIEDNKLWANVYINYCNCTKSNEISKTYEDALLRCKEEEKEIFFFMLNQQGGLGITYPKCDSVLMLDDSTNAEQYYQRIMRCMTEQKKDEKVKKCGIIIDFNWKRQLQWMNDLCNKYQHYMPEHMNKKEILLQLNDYNIFKINPRQHNKFGWNKMDISEHMDFISRDITDNTDEDNIFNDWSCPDTLDINCLTKCYNFTNGVPEYLQGGGQDMPEPSNNGITVDGTDDNGTDDNGTDNKGIDDNGIDDNGNLSIDLFDDNYINKTERFMKDRIFWIFALKMAKDKNCKTFETVIEDDHCNKFIRYMIDQSDIKDSYDNILSSILYIMNDINTKERMNELIELYETTPMDQLRYKIDKHVKASEEERKKNAEVHTCTPLVDKLRELCPSYMFEAIHKIADLSCGKGNIVRGIFLSFFIGLEKLIPDEYERCKTILKECIYIADIEPINIWTTSFLLCLECQSYTSIPYTEFIKMINSYEGDSLKLDIKKVWNIDGFDAEIQNPPYNEKNENGKTKQGKKKLYSDFMSAALKRLNDNGYMIYVTPLGWITGTMSIYNEVIKYNIEYINFNQVKEKYFPNVGDTLCYYSICKTPNKLNTKVIDHNGVELTMAFSDKKTSKIYPVIFTRENLELINKMTTTSNIYNGFINIKEWKEGTRENMKTIIKLRELILTKYKNDELNEEINKELNEKSLKKLASKSGVSNEDIINAGTPDDVFKYEIREFKTDQHPQYTDISIPETYNKKIIIYEICDKIDCKYYDREIYAGSHTFYLSINNDEYGKFLEKWFNSPLFSKLYEINKSSQYLKIGLVKHIILPKETGLCFRRNRQNLDNFNLMEAQFKFYNIDANLRNSLGF